MLFSKKIPWHRQTALRFICLCTFAVCLAGIITGIGCSKPISTRKPPLEKTWICDIAADDAMKRGDYHTALLLHERLLEKEPDNALALYHLGYAYGQTGNHQIEVHYYEKAIALGFTKDAIFFNLGMAYGELNQIEKSLKAFERAVSLDPDNADNHFGLALSYQRRLTDELAEVEFLKAIEIDPKHIDARLYLSLLYADMGELHKASQQLRTILEIDPNHAGARDFLKRIEKE
jgi:tetratricopeptide (TPR) repeat protein